MVIVVGNETASKEVDPFEGLPVGAFLSDGLGELKYGVIGEYALLLLVAGPRLRQLGIDIPEPPGVQLPYEHRLYELLEDEYGNGAYSRYNSLIRRIGRFARALERERRCVDIDGMP